VFVRLAIEGRDLTKLPLIKRRKILNSKLKFQSRIIRIAQYFETTATTVLQGAREQGLEGGVIA
jgi:ATP-dependent DNA ligase